MSEDAKFEDGREVPLNLGALDGEDLKVIVRARLRTRFSQ